MENLTKLTDEEICEFLLNGKKGDAFELAINTKEDKDQSNFINRIVYKDKNVEIVYSYLAIAKDDLIQQFFINSNWWGKIKNSFFTLERFKGKCEEKRYGVININELKNFSINSDFVHINNKNEQAKIEVSDFDSLTKQCQRKYKASISYEVIEVISLSPKPWVKIKINMPDGKVYYSEGLSKKDAANRFANKYIF